MKKIAILGSTGSIGTQTLEVVRNNGDLQVTALAAGSNVAKLEEQIATLRQRVNCLELKQAPQQVQIRQEPPKQAARDVSPKSRPSVRVRLEQIKAGQAAQAFRRAEAGGRP